MTNAVRNVIIIVFILGGVLLSLVWFGVLPGFGGSQAPTIKRAELLIWSTIDDKKSAFEDLIATFQKNNPGIKIQFEKKKINGYEQELLKAFAAGRGPDIFSIHHTWALRYADILYPAPPTVFSVSQFKEMFVDTVGRDLVLGENIYGVPLYVDTLALYYNSDLFNSAGIVFPPKNWDEFVEYSRALTRRKQNGDIFLAGSAMGGARNIPTSSDILALLMLQYGASITDVYGKFNLKSISSLRTGGVEKAFSFYTSFAKSSSDHYSWSKDFSQTSEDLFAQNKVGMIIGYSDTRENLLKKSPYLKFKIAPVPQVKDIVFHKNLANYWGYGVYKQSVNREVAWQFLKFLTVPQNQRYYLSSVKRAASQRELIFEQQKDLDIKVFADQALTATSWVQLDAEIIREAFKEMIEMHINSDQSLAQTLGNAEKKINSLLRNILQP